MHSLQVLTRLQPPSLPSPPQHQPSLTPPGGGHMGQGSPKLGHFLSGSSTRMKDRDDSSQTDLNPSWPRRQELKVRP